MRIRTRFPHLAILSGIILLLVLYVRPWPVNTDSMPELADPEAEYKLLCRNEYRIEYEKKGFFRTVAVASAPRDLADLCERKVRVTAKPRFFYGQPLCSPQARPDCQKLWTLVIDIQDIKLAP